MAPKNIAVLASVWWSNGHADWLTRDGTLTIASAYVEKGDTALPVGKGIPVYPTIANALTLGGPSLAVDGIILIADQGDYPRNLNGQKLWPNPSYFNQIQAVFTASSKVCPIFNSKMLAPTFTQAKTIYDRCKTNSIPLMAGSVYPLAHRKFNNELPLNSPLTKAVAIGSSHRGNGQDLEHFTVHALEALQSQMERRLGGETGVASVRCLSGVGMWNLFDNLSPGTRTFLENLLGNLSNSGVDYVTATEGYQHSAIVVINYIDGTKALLAMLDNYVVPGPNNDVIIGGLITGLPNAKIGIALDYATGFSAMTTALVNFFNTGVAQYPVERTLLCNGILDAAMRSRANGGTLIPTPALNIVYAAGTYPYIPGPIPVAV